MVTSTPQSLSSVWSVSVWPVWSVSVWPVWLDSSWEGLMGGLRASWRGRISEGPFLPGPHVPPAVIVAQLRTTATVGEMILVLCLRLHQDHQVPLQPIQDPTLRRRSKSWSVCLDKSTNDHPEQFLNSTAMFISECNDEQIRLFPHIFTQVCHDYASQMNFARALHFFEVCFTILAVAVSHIMLEAYKKFILVALIDQGGKAKEIMTLPKYTSYVVSKYLQPLCSPYTELITSYYSNDLSSLQTTINKYADTYESDSNSGLVDQVLSSQTKTNIKRLTKTFLTLSLNELAVRVGLSNSDEAEKLVVQMIQEGSIHAKISQKDGMVRFDNNPEHFNSSEVLETLEAKITRCMALDNQLQSLTEVIETNAEYVKRSGALAYSAGAATSKEDPVQSMSLSNGSGAVSGSGPATSFSSSGPTMGNGSVPFS